jgi:hypothetical protein
MTNVTHQRRLIVPSLRDWVMVPVKLKLPAVIIQLPEEKVMQQPHMV